MAVVKASKQLHLRWRETSFLQKGAEALKVAQVVASHPAARVSQIRRWAWRHLRFNWRNESRFNAQWPRSNSSAEPRPTGATGPLTVRRLAFVCERFTLASDWRVYSGWFPARKSGPRRERPRHRARAARTNGASAAPFWRPRVFAPRRIRRSLA